MREKKKSHNENGKAQQQAVWEVPWGYTEKFNY